MVSEPMACIFCDIATKSLATPTYYENEDIIAFPDNAPKYPIHVLIIPKRHLCDSNAITAENSAIIGRLFYVATLIAKKSDISATGYRMLINSGKNAGQEVSHLHVHLIGGTQLASL